MLMHVLRSRAVWENDSVSAIFLHNC